MSRETVFKGDVRIFVAVIFAYLVGAWCLVGLAWDGSGYFFNSLQSGEPIISHQRYSNYPVLAVIVQAAKVISDPWKLGVLYSALLALTPIGSLALSLWFLRSPRLAPLRIWPVLGILPAALPGEICLMSEASLATQAFWPILAFVAASLPTRATPWIVALSLYLFFLHPTSALMFFLAAALCGGLAFGQREVRAKAILWSFLLFGVGLTRLVYSVQTATPYERGELGWEANWMAFQGSILWLPLGLLGCLYLFGLAGLARLTGRISSPVARRLGIGSAAVFLLIGLVWAFDSRFWAGAIGYRRFILIGSLPLIGLGGLHWIWLQRVGKKALLKEAFPESANSWVAAGFALIFIVQSLSWRSDIIRFQSVLQRAPGPFITRAELPWVKGRALDHWSSSMLSVIVQGRSPRVLYAETRGHIQGDDIELFPDGWLRANDAWFQLDPGHRQPK